MLLSAVLSISNMLPTNMIHVRLPASSVPSIAADGRSAGQALLHLPRQTPCRHLELVVGCFTLVKAHVLVLSFGAVHSPHGARTTPIPYRSALLEMGPGWRTKALHLCPHYASAASKVAIPRQTTQCGSQTTFLKCTST